MRECESEMDRRFTELRGHGVQKIEELPSSVVIPRIVIVFDEFADLMTNKSAKKYAEGPLRMLVSKGRAAGLHLILSTQRPENNVVIPLIRDNLPNRIALRVASIANSKLIIGSPDAANLVGRGDLYWKCPKLQRLQSPFVSKNELEKSLRCQRLSDVAERVPEPDAKNTRRT